MRQNLFLTLTVLISTLFLYQNCSESSYQNPRSTASSSSLANKNEAGIDYSPVDQTVFVGGQALFDVGVSGGYDITYKWYKDGRRIYGEDRAQINIKNAQLDDAGSYEVEVLSNEIVLGSVGAKLEVLLCQAGTKKYCEKSGKSGAMVCSQDGMEYSECNIGDSADEGVKTATNQKSCKLPWGGDLAHGKSTKAYNAKVSTNCQSSTRKCNNGSLSGKYSYKSCKKKMGKWKYVKNSWKRIGYTHSNGAPGKLYCKTKQGKCTRSPDCPKEGSTCTYGQKKTCKYWQQPTQAQMILGTRPTLYSRFQEKWECK